MSAVVRFNGKEYRLSIGNGHIIWCKAVENQTILNNSREQVPLTDILAILPTLRGERLASRDCPRDHRELSVFTFKKKGRFVRRLRSHVFKFQKDDECQPWCEKLQGALQEVSQRPRRLHVFINPVGGRRKAPKIYAKKIAPLFDLAGIHVTIVVTERANHALDMLKEMDLRHLDGIVCVGGDGMFHEVLNGLLLRTQADAGVSVQRARFIPAPPRIAIGIIPAGSTDAMAFSIMNCADPATAAMHIILGDRQPIDIASIESGGTLMRFASLACSYGFLGDTLEDSETLRWLGPRRYDVAGAKWFFRNRGYDCCISFLPSKDSDHHPLDRSQCLADCDVCHHGMDEASFAPTSEKGASAKASNCEVSDTDGDGWKKMEGRMTSVVACMSRLASPRSPRGLSPSAHFGDGCLDLIMVKHGSRLNTLRQLIKISSSATHLSLPFISVLRCREIRFQAVLPPELQQSSRQTPEEFIDESSGTVNPSTRRRSAPRQDEESPSLVQSGEDRHQADQLRQAQSIWNVDGEIVKQASIDIRVHRQLISLFARGIERQEGVVGCFSRNYQQVPDNTG